MIGDDEVVGIDGICERGDAFKNIRVRDPFQFELRLVLFMHRLNLDFFGVRQQRPDDDAGLVAERMHAQQRVRRLMGQFDQAAQFIFGEQHNGQRI